MYGYVVNGRIKDEKPRQYIVLANDIPDARLLYAEEGIIFDLIDEFIPTTSSERWKLMEKHARRIIRLGDMTAPEPEDRLDKVLRPIEEETVDQPQAAGRLERLKP